MKKIIKDKTSYDDLKQTKWEDEIYREDIEPLSEVLTDITFFAYYLGKSHIADQADLKEFAKLGSAFTFIEAMNYFKKKLPVTMYEFNENRDKLSDKAFYISRVNDKRLVEDIHKELTKAIEKGIPFNKWKKGVNELFDRKGVSRINPYHLETVYRTNVQGAYAKGRYEQISTPEMREAFPYWRYSAVMDRSVRPAHRSLHGLVLPNDHPRWSSIYPPTGFNCRCTVIVIDKGYFDRKGLPEPKKGEYSFIYKDKDSLVKVPPENPKGRVKKGKTGWNVQTIKEDKFIFPERDAGFNSTRKDITMIDPKIHGDDPGKFGLKNRLSKPYKTKKIEGKELPVVNSNDEWKALLEEKSQNYDFERQVHKGIAAVTTSSAASMGKVDLVTSAQNLGGALGAFQIEAGKSMKVVDMFARATQVTSLKMEDLKTVARDTSMAAGMGQGFGTMTAMVEMIKKIAGSTEQAGTMVKGFSRSINIDLFSDSYFTISGIWNKLKSFFIGLWNGIKGIFSEVKNWITNKVKQTVLAYKLAWNKIKSFFTGLWNKIKGVFSKIKSLLPSSDAKEGPFSNLTASGMGFIGAFSKGITSQASRLKSSVAKAFTGVMPDQKKLNATITTTSKQNIISTALAKVLPFKKESVKLGISNRSESGIGLPPAQNRVSNSQESKGIYVDFKGAHFNFQGKELPEGSSERQTLKEQLVELMSEAVEQRA